MKVLVLNAGSSSIKFELFDVTDGRSLAEGSVERIGERGAPVPDHGAAIARVVDTLREAGVLDHVAELLGVGHRVVHGGERFVEPVRIDETVLAGIREHARLAPLHNPANLLGIERAREALPGVPQVAVFDTAFHQTLPPQAFRYALPEAAYREHGVRRYGFHGISVQYVARAAAKHLGLAPEDADLIVLHLGNGASATAVQRGQSIDTSMGLTPLEGLVMGTRGGDLDPGIPGYLMAETGAGSEDITRMLNRDSGLQGLCGASDFREVRRRSEGGDAAASLALEVYAYRIRKYVGAYLAVLGRADAIVFTGGVGEHQPWVRAHALSGLEGLGIHLDPTRNDVSEGGIADIHSDLSQIRVLVVPTDEEREIAEQVVRCLAPGRPAPPPDPRLHPDT